MSKMSRIRKRPLVRRGNSPEDLTKIVQEQRGARTRMRVVVEVDVEEDFSRDAFNDTVVDWARKIENYNATGDNEIKIVLLTTEEVSRP
jgi:hypothetical protein